MRNDHLLPGAVTRDAIVQELEQYEALLREYKSLKDTNPAITKLPLFEEKVKSKQERIWQLQREINGAIRQTIVLDLCLWPTATLKRELRRFERWLSNLPKEPIMPGYNQPFEEWQKSLEEACEEIRDSLDERGESLPQSQQHATRIASQVQAYLETVRLLEERCEEDVKKHPNQESEIRRRYRKAIDALKDTP